MKTATASIFMLTALLSAAPGRATPYQSSVGLTTYGSQIEFGSLGLAQNTYVTNQFAAYGVTFSNLWLNDTYSFPNQSSGQLADFTGNGQGGQYPAAVGPITISFSSAVSYAVFSFVSNPASTVMSAYLGGTLVESDTFSTGYDGDYTGFTGITFDSIIISPGANDAGILANFESSMTLSSVPEPSSLALLGVALFGLGWVRFRGETVT